MTRLERDALATRPLTAGELEEIAARYDGQATCSRTDLMRVLASHRRALLELEGMLELQKDDSDLIDKLRGELADLFRKWDDGIPSFDDGDGAYLGNAFKLPREDCERIETLIGRKGEK